MPPDTLTKLEQMIKLLETGVTKEEFTTTVENILKLVVQIEAKTSQAISTLETTYQNLMGKMSGDHAQAFTDLKGQVDQVFVGHVLDQMKKDIADRLAKIKDGKDGLRGAKGDKGDIGKQGSPDTAWQIRNKLEILTGEDRLDISAVKGAEERISKLENRPTRTGGGTTDIGVAFSLSRIVQTETPSGAIDGVNTAYTVVKEIKAILFFIINGEAIHPAEYTVSKHTITFTTPLPASLSGKNFTIVYV